MVSLRRRKCLRLSPCNGSSNVLAPLPGFSDNETDTDAKPDSVHPMPSNDEDGLEELNLPEVAKTVSVLNNAKRKMRKIYDLMEITETEIIESPKKYQVDLKKPEHRWKKVLRKEEKSLKVSEGTKDKLEKVVKKLRTNSDHYLEELNLLQRKNEDESKLTAELIKTCQKELKEAEDNNHAFTWDYYLLDRSHVLSLENIWLEAQDQNMDEEGSDTLENEEVKNKIDILDDRLNKLKEERRLEKAERDAAMVECEKLHRDVELSRVALDLAKAETAAIKTEKDKIEEQNEEVKNKIDILEAMVKKRKEEQRLQKAEVEAAKVESEKLRRDVEMSRVAVDMAKAETATIKAEKVRVEEQNDIEMGKKRKHNAAPISEVKRYYSCPAYDRFSKLDILAANLKKRKEERLQKAVVEAAKVESEKLRRDVELSMVAVDMAKAETATIKAENVKVEEQNDIEMGKKRKHNAAPISEVKRYYSCPAYDRFSKLDILAANLKKRKEERLQKAVVEAAKVESEKLRRDVELSIVAVDMAKAETATIKAENVKVEEQNDIEMGKKRKHNAAPISEVKRYYSCPAYDRFSKLDILAANLKKRKEERLQKAVVEAAKVESEKLRRHVELSMVAVDMAKTVPATIKAEKDKVEEKMKLR